ncbi:uncharacterized protein LOC143276877 [Babylonia areolata]|uniref:uncharacterized protein LOC143276877 n=1 Tax=Babylonia areolata TaxID=304850 RepID=UPI003FD5F031
MKEAVEKIREEVDGMKDTASTESLWTHFKTELLEAVQTHIPSKKSRPNYSQPWITPELRRLINRRNRAYKKWKKGGGEDLKAEAKARRREAQRHLHRAYWDYINATLTEEPTEHAPKYKRFWSYIKNQKAANVGVAPLKVNGQLKMEPREKADILNNWQFQSAFSEGKTYSREEFQEKCEMAEGDYPVLNSVDIAEEGVRRLLMKLDPAKASGPDNISASLLKELSCEIAPILTTIYRSSLDTGCHGFRQQRSCETQLIELVEELTSSMASGRRTDVLVLDFGKAFDKVNHSLLLHKLHNYGVRGKINKWISDFLANRCQAVVVEGAQSNFIDVKSGVPQGSVLGPCLFLVFINDLPENLTSKTRMFADDTAMYRAISSTEDHAHLQEDLERLQIWERKWEMAFNPGKCATLRITRCKNSPSSFKSRVTSHLKVATLDSLAAAKLQE